MVGAENFGMLNGVYFLFIFFVAPALCSGLLIYLSFFKKYCTCKGCKCK